MQLPFKPNALIDQLPNFRLLLRAVSREFRLGLLVNEDAAARVLQSYSPEDYSIRVQRHGAKSSIAFCRGDAPLLLLTRKANTPSRIWVVNATAVRDLVYLLLRGRNLPGLQHFESRARSVQVDTAICPPTKPRIHAVGFSAVKVKTFDPRTTVEGLRAKQKVGSFYCFWQGRGHPVASISTGIDEKNGLLTVGVGDGLFASVTPAALLWVAIPPGMMPEGFNATVPLEAFMRRGPRWVPVNITQKGLDEQSRYWVLDIIQFHEHDVRPSYIQAFCARSPHKELVLGDEYAGPVPFMENEELLVKLKVSYLDSMAYLE